VLLLGSRLPPALQLAVVSIQIGKQRRFYVTTWTARVI
jgi:hypothetical protein